MRDKVSMKQMVLPQLLTPEQVDCARQVARELGLKTEKVRPPTPTCLMSLCTVNTTLHETYSPSLGTQWWTTHLQRRRENESELLTLFA